MPTPEITAKMMKVNTWASKRAGKPGEEREFHQIIMWFTVLTNLAGTPNFLTKILMLRWKSVGCLDLVHDADPCGTCGTLGPWMALVPQVTSRINLAALPINPVIPCHSSMFWCSNQNPKKNLVNLEYSISIYDHLWWFMIITSPLFDLFGRSPLFSANLNPHLPTCPTGVVVFSVNLVKPWDCQICQAIGPKKKHEIFSWNENK